MPSQLLEDLRRFLDQGSGQPQDQAGSTHYIDIVMRAQNTPRHDVLVANPHPDPAKPNEPALNHTPHWPDQVLWGSTMVQNNVAANGVNRVSGVNTISIHETSGWPAWEGGDNMVKRHLCIAPYNEWIPPAGPPPAQGHWVTREAGNKGIGPQYYVDGNGTVFALVGEFDLGAEPRITFHTETVNGTSVGIENGSVGDYDGLRPDINAAGPYWFRLDTTRAQDLPGLAVFALLHPRSDQADLVLVWFSTAARGAAIPNYPGSGDTVDIPHRYSNWNQQLFTERDYRSLALLVRLIFEKYGVPRNFCILPWSKVDADGNNKDILRKTMLADERREMMARKLHITVADIQNRTNAWTGLNNQNTWFKFFGVDPTPPPVPGNPHPDPQPLMPTYRGVIGHALVGAHPCPGPLFDWHRFSRQAWDWWWYPFDLNIFLPALFPPRRDYMQARGDTTLHEHYYDAAEPGADFAGIGQRYNALGRADVDNVRGANHFALAVSTPVYAMANGVVVAARLQNPADPLNPPFVLIRHKVFHQADPATHALDYDHAPSIVWTLTTYLDCSSFDYTLTTTGNPDWLNRMIMRLKECELAVAFKAAHPGVDPNSPQYHGHPVLFANDHRFQQAWNRAPTSTGPRPTPGDGIQADADEYRRIVNALQAGNFVLFPLESAPNTTPVQVILGDFLGPCGAVPDIGPSPQIQTFPGIQVQTFSMEQLIPNSPHGALFWTNQAWYVAASAAARLDGTPNNSLPADGIVYSFPMTGFLDWINAITWGSEWLKYEVVDAAGNAVAAPQRPQTRLGL
jgi:N-acetylmuramoyl-L-alanine amidase